MKKGADSARTCTFDLVNPLLLAVSVSFFIRPASGRSTKKGALLVPQDALARTVSFGAHHFWLNEFWEPLDEAGALARSASARRAASLATRAAVAISTGEKYFSV